jgi:hypothetical protein
VENFLQKYYFRKNKNFVEKILPKILGGNKKSFKEKSMEKIGEKQK